MNLPAGVKDWRTTLLGLAKLANGIVPAWQIYQTAMAGLLGPTEVKRLAMYGATFLLINGTLQAISGAITPSAAKVKQKTEEMVDRKIAESSGS